MDFNDLMKAAEVTATTEKVDVPGLGVMEVRGLSRAESLIVGKAEGDPTATERVMLRLGLVEPALTEAQVREWLAVAPNEHVDPVTKAIARLSGMYSEAPKEAYKSAGDEPGD